MYDVVERLDVSGVQAGAGTGRHLSCGGDLIECASPIDGSIIGAVRAANRDDYREVAAQAVEAFRVWSRTPAPKRGEIVRQFGNALRRRKKELGELVSIEMGKIRAEGEGEVQEMIDMADFAVGQSRMLYGKSMHSERPFHRMYEQWHPVGPTGVVTAFNFPVSVWAWNAMLALIAGDTVIWKPSSKTPLSAVAVSKIAWEVLGENDLPGGILNLVVGAGHTIGEEVINDRSVPLVSFTGSMEMGRHVARVVKGRLGRTLLELGGNNGIVVSASADLSLAVRAILFGAVGTAGQRCTSTRRVIAQRAIYPTLVSALVTAYKQVRIGNPLDAGTLMGPLIDKEAVGAMQRTINNLKQQGGEVLFGGEVLSGGLFDTGTYVEPCVCAAKPHMPVVAEETFAPVLYVMEYETLEEAIAYHNAVPQGLSSAIFTNDLKEAEAFLSHAGSDCGIANVNIGTSGAEIGGAFGGEKETGGGRESGSDSWKAYMRRQTCTINWSNDLPLAQGIEFQVE